MTLGEQCGATGLPWGLLAQPLVMITVRQPYELLVNKTSSDSEVTVHPRCIVDARQIVVDMRGDDAVMLE